MSMDADLVKLWMPIFIGVGSFFIGKIGKVVSDVGQLKKDVDVLHEWKRLTEKRLDGEKK